MGRLGTLLLHLLHELIVCEEQVIDGLRKGRDMMVRVGCRIWHTHQEWATRCHRLRGAGLQATTSSDRRVSPTAASMVEKVSQVSMLRPTAKVKAAMAGRTLRQLVIELWTCGLRGSVEILRCSCSGR